MNGDDAFARRPAAGAQIPEKIQKAFDDIAKYFSKEEWEKMKASEKIFYVYMKRKYEAMTKLGFKATLPPFMCNKRAEDFQGNDFDNDPNRGNQVERPQMTFGRLQGISPKIMPKKPAEEGNDSEEVPEASGPQNDGKQLCPPGKPTTSEKIHERSGNREAQEKEERRGTAHRWSSQNTHNIGPKRGEHAWTHRLRERKQLVIYEEISDPEEDDE
ncbi:protein SSX2 isoform X2 [Gorilla gorilla gorilla]|uniref:protein SSX2 isoform X3 n=1 Tax=Gorilla gorilla gorilla TaxID=9595 RepID=UPI0024464038|nr:protein SSX2 isoform X2 [Gorilla gorilla gorilla]XP_055231963.1 protein SSX2 isoform X2 [Gorilla gorilla gorilla]